MATGTNDPSTSLHVSPQRLYEVRGSLPPEEGRTWRANVRRYVLAPDLHTAVRWVMTKYPTIDLHDVMSRSGTVAVDFATDPS